EFDGRAAMNIRGNTSLRYPKRSFHLKTRSESGASLKASILGLPKESDWVLYAPYPDKTLMRDVLAYELSNKMGRYAPHTRFVEVFVSSSGKLSMEDYLGVYVFEEKIKRSKERVDIAKLGPEDVKEPEISGGYIFKKDHLDRMTVVPPPSELGGPGRLGGTMIRPGLPSSPGGFPAKADGFLKSYGSEFFPNMQFPQRKLPGRRGLQRNAVPDPPPVAATPEIPFIQGFNDESISSNLGFSTPMGNQFFYVEPKPGELASAQKTWLKRYVTKFERALYGPDFRDPAHGYAAFIDADSFIDHHLLVEATKNVDGFRFSTFYYKDRGGKIRMGPIWDWNLAFGNVNGKQGWMPRYWYWPQLDDNQYSWFRRLFQDPDFGQKYVDRWAALRTNVFATSNVLARIDELAAQLNEAQARNFRRWPILGRTVWPNHFVRDSFQEEVNWLKEYIESRFSWIDEQFVAAPEASTENNKLILRTPKDQGARIYYTLDGSDPRGSGGDASSSAKIYDAPIALKQNSRMFARAFQNNLWSGPALRNIPAGER
ncbi:MAG TPA: CotH kinase family protein, partial [Verrucomicrobiae bacterium]|nr:CotH kinase family protein [Verrucomicrobiae bacterium]